MSLFASYTPLSKCVGKEIEVRTATESYRGMLAGIYEMGGQSVLVLTPMEAGGTEYHIPLIGSVVVVQQQQ